MATVDSAAVMVRGQMMVGARDAEASSSGGDTSGDGSGGGAASPLTGEALHHMRRLRQPKQSDASHCADPPPSLPLVQPPFLHQNRHNSASLRRIWTGLGLDGA